MPDHHHLAVLDGRRGGAAARRRTAALADHPGHAGGLGRRGPAVRAGRAYAHLPRWPAERIPGAATGHGRVGVRLHLPAAAGDRRASHRHWRGATTGGRPVLFAARADLPRALRPLEPARRGRDSIPGDVRLHRRLQRLHLGPGPPACGYCFGLPVCELGGRGDTGLAVLPRGFRRAGGGRHGHHFHGRGAGEAVQPAASYGAAFGPAPVTPPTSLAPSAPPAVHRKVMIRKKNSSTKTTTMAKELGFSSILSACCTLGSFPYILWNCSW